MGDVVVVVEHRDGRVQDTTLEALTKGREVAQGSGGHVRALVLGNGVEGVAQAVASYGVDVLLGDHQALTQYTAEAYAQALRSVAEVQGPALLLAAHTATGYDFMPRMAGEAGLPLVTDCLDLALRDGRLEGRKGAFNGKVVVELELSGKTPFVATLRPGTARATESSSGPGKVSKVSVQIDPSRIHRRVVGYERPETGDVDITQAEVIVAAGRGIKDKANLKLIEEFAQAVGGVVAGSRPIVDKEWLPWSRQVGSSGKTVKPKVYIACGISGATQHVTGMKGAETIIAINTDPSAPIFEVATYGVVGDLFKVIPATLKELRGG